MRGKRLAQLTTKLVTRFWKNVSMGHGPNGGCWEWRGRSNRKGYGVFFLERETLAHRVAYKIYYGVDPFPFDLLHSCHNTLCVNPFHLRTGTHKENMQDRDSAGRHRTMRGVEHKNAKLDDTKVKTIRRKFSDGVTKMDLAREFEVSHRLIRNIVNRVSWAHI